MDSNKRNRLAADAPSTSDAVHTLYRFWLTGAPPAEQLTVLVSYLLLTSVWSFTDPIRPFVFAGTPKNYNKVIGFRSFQYTTLQTSSCMYLTYRLYTLIPALQQTSRKVYPPQQAFQSLYILSGRAGPFTATHAKLFFCYLCELWKSEQFWME